MPRVKHMRVIALAVALVFLFSSVAFAAVPQYVYFQSGSDMVKVDYAKAVNDAMNDDNTLYNAVKQYVGAAEETGAPVIVETDDQKVLDYQKALGAGKRFADIVNDPAYQTSRPEAGKELRVENGQAVIGDIRPEVVEISSITPTDTLGVVEIVAEGTTAEALQAAITPACTVVDKEGVPNTYIVTIQNAAYDQEITLQFAAGFQLKAGVNNKVKWASPLPAVLTLDARAGDDETITVSGTVKNAVSVNISITNAGNQEVASATGVAVADGSFTWKSDPLAAGNYTVSVVAVKDEQTSEAKTANVTVSNVAPTIASVTAIDGTHVKVVFSEPIRQAGAQNTANYDVKKLSDTSWNDDLAAAVLQADKKTVILTLGNSLVPSPNGFVLVIVQSGAEHIADLRGNEVVAGSEMIFSGIGTSDTVKPEALSASYDPAAGRLAVRFSEAMSTATANFVKTGFSLSNGASTVTLGVNETGDWSQGNTVLTITLSASKKAEVNALGANMTLSIAADAVKDVALNGIAAVSGIPVSAQAVLSAASYDEATNELTLTFSRAVDVSTLVKGEFTLDGTGATRTLGAADTVTTTQDGTTVKITLAKNAALDAYEGAAVTGRNVDFSAASGAFVDVSGLAVAATRDVPLNYVEDTTKPVLVSATFNASNSRLTLTFSEPVQVDTSDNSYQIDNTKIHFTEGAFATGQANCETYTNDGVATSAATVVFHDTSNNLTSNSKIYFDAGAVKDDAGNEIAEVTQANAVVISFLDQTPPTVNASATQVSANTVTLTFSEPVDRASAENVANYTITKDDNPSVTLTVTAARLNAAGDKVTLTVSPAGTIGYTYNIKVSNVKDRYNNTMVNANMVGTDIAQWTVDGTGDTTGPTAGALTYTDVDGSKSITAGDTIEIAFNEVLNVDFSKVTAADFSVSNNHNLGTNPTFAYGSGNDRVKITLGANPTITWGDTITPAADNDIKDLAGNSAQQHASEQLTNPGTAPKITSISYADTNASGVVDAGDKLTITYDRNITLPNGISALSADDFTLSGGLSFGSSPSFEVQGGNQIVVTLGGSGIAVDASVGTDDAIDEAESSDIADEWGVTQGAADDTTARVTSADRTQPTIVSVVFNDANDNLIMDQGETIVITVSEPIGKTGDIGNAGGQMINLYNGPTANPLSDAGTPGKNPNSLVTVSGNKITITLDDGTNNDWTGEAVNTTTTFNLSGTVPELRDASGNVLAPAAGFGVTISIQ